MNKELAVEYYKKYLTYEEIGHILGTKKERVRQVLNKMLLKDEFLRIKKKRRLFRVIWNINKVIPNISQELLDEARCAKEEKIKILYNL